LRRTFKNGHGATIVFALPSGIQEKRFMTMIRRRKWAALAVAAALAASQAEAQDGLKGGDRTVSVSATGSAAASPDRASISTGVMTEAATAREALSLNTTAMKKLIDGLKALGLEPRDIQTTTVQVNPRYADGRGNKAPTITGYQAVNQVRIVVRDMKRLGEILDQSITLGANQMGGIGFEVSNAEVLKDDARKAAMVNARRRAELYAAAAGATVGPVLAISETQANPQPRMYGGARAAMAEAVPVEPGSVDLTVQVHVTWALK
jgi:uncharacterized protein